MKTPRILEKRQSQWGDPVATHVRIAQVWSGILDHEVTPQQVALCMAGMKLVRSSVNQGEGDSYADAKGYVDIAGMIAEPTDDYRTMLMHLRGISQGRTPQLYEEYMYEAEQQAYDDYMYEAERKAYEEYMGKTEQQEGVVNGH